MLHPVPDSALGPRMGLGKKDRLRRERPRRQYGAWPNEVAFEVDRLLKLGASAKQIMERTPFASLSALYNFCDYRGWPIGRKGRAMKTPPAKLDAIWTMFRERHMGPTTIARKLGTTRNAIVGILWRYDMRRRPARPEQWVMVYGRYENPRTREQLGWKDRAKGLDRWA